MRTWTIVTVAIIAVVSGLACDRTSPQSEATAAAPAQATQVDNPGAAKSGPTPTPAPVTPAVVPESQPSAASPHGAGVPGPTSQPAGTPTSLPTGHPPVEGGQAGPLGTVKGTVSLAAELKDAVKPGSVLFLIVRRDAGPDQKGMLLAAKKVVVKGSEIFPLAYEVTQADVMMTGTRLDGIVRVSARIDQDGDALSKTSGDLVGAIGQPVPVGSNGVNFQLDSKIP